MAEKTDGKKAVRNRKTGKSAARPDSDTLWQMIAETAYFKAEQRGFDHGDPLQDWLEAEQEIVNRFAA